MHNGNAKVKKGGQKTPSQNSDQLNPFLSKHAPQHGASQQTESQHKSKAASSDT